MKQKNNKNFTSGVILFNKPSFYFSRKIDNLILKKYNYAKVGHLGTLDFLASGLMVILINNATKLANYLHELNKTYLATIKLFIATTTFDGAGKIIAWKSGYKISKKKIKTILKQFNNCSYFQTPPIYSSLKKNGKRLYKYALKNQKIDIKPRLITIYRLKFLKYDFKTNQLKILITCSKGTYIRSLATDIGKKLNIAATLFSLSRTKIGNFKLKQVNKNNKLLNLYPILKKNNFFVKKFLNKKIINKIKQNNMLALNSNQLNLFCFNKQKELIAIYQKCDNNNKYKIKKNFLINKLKESK